MTKYYKDQILKRELLLDEEIYFYYILEILNFIEWSEEEQREVLNLLLRYFPENLEQKYQCKSCLVKENSLSESGEMGLSEHCLGDEPDCLCFCSISRRELEIVDRLLVKKKQLKDE
jgi:hypothetical protein